MSSSNLTLFSMQDNTAFWRTCVRKEMCKPHPSITLKQERQMLAHDSHIAYKKYCGNP
jgi:hypothetical protein